MGQFLGANDPKGAITSCRVSLVMTSTFNCSLLLEFKQSLECVANVAASGGSRMFTRILLGDGQYTTDYYGTITVCLHKTSIYPSPGTIPVT